MGQASSEAAAAPAEASVRLPGGVDLHARPAADLVRAAMGFDSDVWLGVGEREADAKSLLSILALGARGGSALKLRAEGSDALSAIHKLSALIESLDE